MKTTREVLREEIDKSIEGQPGLYLFLNESLLVSDTIQGEVFDNAMKAYATQTLENYYSQIVNQDLFNQSDLDTLKIGLEAQKLKLK